MKIPGSAGILACLLRQRAISQASRQGCLRSREFPEEVFTMKRKRIGAWILFGCVAIGLFALPVGYASGSKAPAKEITFNKEIAPIFFAKCAECHHPGEA